MKKYYLTNGEEVKVGDVIIRTTSTFTEFGRATVTENFTFTEKVIPELLEKGIITTNNTIEENENKIPLCLNYYVKNVAKKMGWNEEEALILFDNIYGVYPAAAFSIILKEIAIELDKQYEDHIRNSSEIWVVSMLDGRISKINKASIRSYKNFAAFRTLEDARIACRISKPILKDMFKDGKQKDKKCSKISL